MGLPDPRALRRREAKLKQPLAPARGVHSSVLEKLAQETREALRGIESPTTSMARDGGVVGEGLDDVAMLEEFPREFQELAGTQDMESIAETMLQQLLSKGLLHEPSEEFVQQYPKWLEENKSKLSKEEYETKSSMNS